MTYDMFVDESRVKNFCSSSKKTRLRGLMYSCDSESHFGNRIISENIKNRVWSPIIHFHSVFDPFFEFRLKEYTPPKKFDVFHKTLTRAIFLSFDSFYMIHGAKDIYFLWKFWKSTFGQHLGNICCLHVALTALLL